MARVAFLGLGVMGYPMAGHLKTKGGHDVTVYNRAAAKAEKWVAQFGGRDLSLKVLPLKLPRTSAVSVAIVTLKNRTLSPAARIFIECVRQVSKSMAGKPQAHKS